MPRPASRVAFCQESARLRSDLGKLRKQLPATPAPGSGDAWAAWRIEAAIKTLNHAEQAWDDPAPKEDE